MIRQETRRQIAEQASSKTRSELAAHHRVSLFSVDAILRETGKKAVPAKMGRKRKS